MTIKGVFMKIAENIIEKECAHIPCGCPVEGGGDYCSDWCKKALDSTDCGCGHPECRAEA